MVGPGKLYILEDLVPAYAARQQYGAANKQRHIQALMAKSSYMPYRACQLLC